MRVILLTLAVTLWFVAPVRSSPPANFDDAALHAIQFVDHEEGWAVGDDGVVLHTIDSGKSWERQPTGVRASLRALHFLNPYTGWVVGRDELPYGGGSSGVLLFTQDGGLKWRQAAVNTFPGLNCIHFVDAKTGFIAGDGTDQFPSGVFATTDSGRTWKPVRGPRCPGWRAADFRDAQTGALAGSWNRLAAVREGAFHAADVEILGGRQLRGLRLAGDRAFAVGQGGLVLVSPDGAGARWGVAELGLPTELRAAWDFHAIHCLGKQVWIAGRPGAVVLHSADQGQTWEILKTGQPLPVNGIWFTDDQRGWVVGELGSILATTDGGKSWRVQRRGGQRAAVLFLHARPTGLPVDTVAVLGGQEGYLTAAVRVSAADPASADLGCAVDSDRLAAAMRRAGGAAGEGLWQFPVPEHLARANQRELLAAWNRLHADRSAEEVLRQLVLAIRVWRPDVIITDHPDADVTGDSMEALVAEAVHEAFQRAADPKAFPEQIHQLGLEPWKASKLYARWDQPKGSTLALNLSEASVRLEATARDFAGPAAGLLSNVPLLLPAQRYYRLLDSRLDGADGHKDLMQGTVLAPGGVARRDLTDPNPLKPEVVKAIRTRRNLEAMAETPSSDLVDPNKMLAQVAPALRTLPEDEGAAAAFAVANHYARLGQWQFARELFLLMANRYPAHPLAADAYRWLIRHNSSSEARRRLELGQFQLVNQVEFQGSEKTTALNPRPLEGEAPLKVKGGLEAVQQAHLEYLADRHGTRQWYQSSLDLGARLAAFGPRFATDPAIQFCLQASRRNLGDLNGPREWYAQFRREHPDGPWSEAAAAESWLMRPVGPSPRPVARCRFSDARPFLDGQLDDPCWQEVKPLVLRNAVGDTIGDYRTEAWLAHDKEFLYLAVRCRHPEDRYVPPVKVRPHDADLRPYDRVELMLDLDRDYSTYFRLQIDQRGCVCDDCWGDFTWDPRWFVAVHSDRTGWQAEAAIPLTELTGDTITGNRVWACNLVRVLPGRGVQAWSVPADVQPRPEGMGLMEFVHEANKKKGGEGPGARDE